MVGHGFKRLFALGIVAAALVIVGCGSSDDGDTTDVSTSSGGKTLSVTVYKQRAETICRKTGEQQEKAVKQVVKEHPPTSSETQAEAAELTLQASKPIFENMVEELEELGLPTGKKGEEFQEWLEAVKEGVDKIEAPGTEGVDATVAAHHKARGLGLKTCSLL